MAKFRKKPVVIEAQQLSDDADWNEVADWCHGHLVNTTFGVPGDDPTTVLRLLTANGWVTAYEGDWIAKHGDDVWPINKERFAATYEPVE